MTVAATAFALAFGRDECPSLCTVATGSSPFSEAAGRRPRRRRHGDHPRGERSGCAPLPGFGGFCVGVAPDGAALRPVPRQRCRGGRPALGYRPGPTIPHDALGTHARIGPGPELGARCAVAHHGGWRRGESGAERRDRAAGSARHDHRRPLAHSGALERSRPGGLGLRRLCRVAGSPSGGHLASPFRRSQWSTLLGVHLHACAHRRDLSPIGGDHASAVLVLALRRIRGARCGFPATSRHAGEPVDLSDAPAFHARRHRPLHDVGSASFFDAHPRRCPANRLGSPAVLR